MASVPLPPYRPLLSAGLFALVIGSLALSGCSSPPKAVKKAATPATAVATRTAAKPTVSPFTATGIPADLAAVIRPVYLGGAVRSSPSALAALRKRTLTRNTAPVVVKGSVATWKGVPIAVVTKGTDVTLAVKAPQWKVVGGWWPSVGAGAPSLGGAPRHILMVGSDARPGQPVARARADSLHIVGLDGRGGGGVLGIARDSYVPLSTGGRGKINSALTFGGPTAMQRTVASATGVPLDGYMLTGFKGFKKLINGIGGLKVKAPAAVKDSGSGANVRKGLNDLSGVEALAYGRARHGVAGGDFGRSANQGLLIMAVAGFTKQAGPTRLPGILNHAAASIDTNLSAEQVLTFVAGIYITHPNKVHNRVAAGTFGMTSDGQSIVLWDSKARRLFADIRNGNL
jgi:polyisoprenyl-teichoic acid--peptidoglycan teichoic acid transferase